MSVEQRIKISCDNFDCDAAIHSGVGLLDARAIAGDAGWVNTVHQMGLSRRPILQDFCPAHREQTFDWGTWSASEKREGRATAKPVPASVNDYKRCGADSAHEPHVWERMVDRDDYYCDGSRS